MPNELVLTTADPRDATELSLLHQIEAFAQANARGAFTPDMIVHFVAKFIASTKLAPALDGEPVFVLRAQDKIAPYAVMAWAREAESYGAPPAKVDGARTIANLMCNWQMRNADRVKRPD